MEPDDSGAGTEGRCAPPLGGVFCAISGEVPREPVASRKSGLVFEKSTILNHFKTSGNVCPVTDKPLEEADLLPLRANAAVPPRPCKAASISGLLDLMRVEWDSVLTETAQLRNELLTTRKQLAHALYRHDAACRVISRLLAEKKELEDRVGGGAAGAAAAAPAMGGAAAAPDSGRGSAV